MDIAWVAILLCGVAGYVGARLGMRAEKRRIRVIVDAEVGRGVGMLTSRTAKHLEELRGTKGELQQAAINRAASFGHIPIPPDRRG